MGICLSLSARGWHSCRDYLYRFVSGILRGAFFPTFVPDNPNEKQEGLAMLFAVHGDKPEDYGKMILWGFIAGFSERFVTDILSRFESKSRQ